MATFPSTPDPSPVDHGHVPVDGLADGALAASGRRVFEIEAQALAAVSERLDGDFSAACRLMLNARGRVVCTGMGKSGHVARKIAATLASTGTTSFYVHPGRPATATWA